MRATISDIKTEEKTKDQDKTKKMIVKRVDGKIVWIDPEEINSRLNDPQNS